jgi:hypothetical protein
VSGILFMEHHTPENIDEDIQYIIDLAGVYTQFMMFTALPGTALYHEYKAKGLIDFDLPYEDWHGQHVLNFHHPHFTKQQSTQILARAFQQEYDQLSSSAYRMLDTSVRGYETLSRLAQNDQWMAVRARQMRESAQAMRLLVPTMRRFAHNALERSRIDEVEARCFRHFGPLTTKMRALQVAARLAGELESVRMNLVGNLRQPKHVRTTYRWDAASATAAEPVRVHLPTAPAAEHIG